MKKQLSRKHEEDIAHWYGGDHSRSSGSSVRTKGDVRNEYFLYECKLSGEPGGNPKGGKLVKDFEKIADQAFEEGRSPVLCLRFWNPDSPLANQEGWIDFSIYMTNHDIGDEIVWP